MYDKSTENNRIIFSISEEVLQEEAMRRIGRRLSDVELDSAIKGIEAGLIFDIETVFQTAIDEAVG